MNLKKILPAVLANFSATLSEILLMASAAWLIVSAELQPPLSALSVGITLVRTAGIFRAVLRYADRFFSHKIIFSILDELREKLFLQAAEKLPMKSGKIGEGNLIHKLTVTAEILKNFLPNVVIPISTAALVAIFLSILLKSFVPVIIFLANLSAVFLKVETANDSDYREKILDFNSARDELKIFGTAPAVKKLNSSAEKFSDFKEKIFARQINFDTAFFIFNTAGIFFILYQLFNTTDKIFFAVWTFILISAIEIFSAVPNALRTYKNISADKIETENKKILQNDDTNFTIEFCNVDFGYTKNNFVLKNFNLKIQCGEKIAIVGESGAGKTTLLYLMTKLFQPDNGNIFTKGKIFAATHENYIFSQSIKFNFEMLHENISDEEIFHALKICQLENFDINSPIGENANFLSSGERVRLQIALAITKNPDVLILDEPTAGLDKIRAENLIDNIIKNSEKDSQTLIVITHDTNISKIFQRVVIVN